MKYFTPGLFAELNADDDDVVDRAEEKGAMRRAVIGST
jgi:hypothetical protein